MPVMEIRKRVELKEGMTLLFEPNWEALAGPESAFFMKYAGNKAKIVGFANGGPSIVQMTARVAGQDTADREPDRLLVEFENGDRSDVPLLYIHFRMP